MTLMLHKDGAVDYEATYAHAHEKHESYQTKNWGKHFRRYWEHLLVPDSIILEVGCGNGKLCKRLAMANYDVTGIDVVPGPYQREGYTFKPVNIVYAPWPFFNQQFTLGLAFDVFEHIEREKLDKAIQEFVRVSRDQAVSIPNCKSVGKLHVTVESIEWWMDKLMTNSDDKWRIVTTEPATKGGVVSVFVRKQ